MSAKPSTSLLLVRTVLSVADYILHHEDPPAAALPSVTKASPVSLILSVANPPLRIPESRTMGKKAKSTKGALKAKERKLDKSTLPPPPKPVDDEVCWIPFPRLCYDKDIFGRNDWIVCLKSISFSFPLLDLCNWTPATTQQYNLLIVLSLDLPNCWTNHPFPAPVTRL